MKGSESFKKSLDEEYNFPASYNFKFIVASVSKNKIIDLLPEAKCSEKTCNAQHVQYKSLFSLIPLKGPT